MTEVTIQVEGMTCGGCVASVTKALQRVAGVQDVAVDLAGATARVVYDEAAATRSQLAAAIDDAGYHAIDAVN